MPIRTMPLPWTTIAAASTTATGLPATGWMPAVQVQKMRVNLEVRGITGNIEVTIGYQTANTEDSQDTPIAVDTYRTTNGVFYASTPTDISSTTLAKQLVRFVWMAKVTAGSSLSTARVGGSVNYSDC